MLRRGRSKGGVMLNEYEIAADGRDVKEELMKALKEKGRVIQKEGVYLQDL